MLHQKYDRISAVEELLPLAFQILRYQMIGLRRKQQRRGEPTDGPWDERPPADPRPNPEQHAARQEMLERLEQASESFSERCRELLLERMGDRWEAEP